ncbi:hypothetical protein [Thermoactinomyces sp. DSM 45892]|uniref:hypothetical protein n=1 Tax=Thermoactinomyces sp. DSM 45892 TaxID=1882753 RepID=UPI0008964A9A|nr:hypothetical protein [Thermoactinomyces sp. DSM 45892]SDZ00881.1 hypothetical protein SAMN05444416_111108 [Thermoactinomyces sp. DSM 45892]
MISVSIEDLEGYSGKSFLNAASLIKKALESVSLLVTQDLSSLTETQKEALKVAVLSQASYMSQLQDGFDVAVNVAGSVNVGNFSFSSGSEERGAMMPYNPSAIRSLMKAGLLTTKVTSK